jgi:ferritin
MLDCPVDLGGVAAPTNGFASHVDPIKLALEQEQKVTVHISELFQIAREHNGN